MALCPTFQHYISDLPKDAKVFDINDILNLETQKLQTKTTGAKIVQEIQDWLLTRVSLQETAVLPEDKIQRLLVGVGIIFLCSLDLSMHLFEHCSHVSNWFSNSNSNSVSGIQSTRNSHPCGDGRLPPKKRFLQNHQNSSSGHCHVSFYRCYRKCLW